MVLQIYSLSMFFIILGFVVHGSNGEYVFLTEKERVEIIGKVREFATKDKLIIAGSGCECKFQLNFIVPRFDKIIGKYSKFYIQF